MSLQLLLLAPNRTRMNCKPRRCENISFSICNLFFARSGFSVYPSHLC